MTKQCNGWVSGSRLALEYAYDSDLKYVCANDKFAQFAGPDSARDIIGKTGYDMLWKAYADILAKNNLEFIFSHEKRKYSYNRFGFGGYHYRCHNLQQKVFDENGEFIFVADVSIIETKMPIDSLIRYSEILTNGNVGIFSRGKWVEMTPRETDVLINSVLAEPSRQLQRC